MGYIAHKSGRVWSIFKKHYWSRKKIHGHFLYYIFCSLGSDDRMELFKKFNETLILRVDILDICHSWIESICYYFNQLLSFFLFNYAFLALATLLHFDLSVGTFRFNKRAFEFLLHSALLLVTPLPWPKLQSLFSCREHLRLTPTVFDLVFMQKIEHLINKERIQLFVLQNISKMLPISSKDRALNQQPYQFETRTIF